MLVTKHAKITNDQMKHKLVLNQQTQYSCKAKTKYEEDILSNTFKSQSQCLSRTRNEHTFNSKMNEAALRAFGSEQNDGVSLCL